MRQPTAISSRAVSLPDPFPGRPVAAWLRVGYATARTRQKGTGASDGTATDTTTGGDDRPSATWAPRVSPAAKNLIELPTTREALAFLDRLASGEASSPGVAETRQTWASTMPHKVSKRLRRGLGRAEDGEVSDG
jgi:hypothetical protein